MALLGSAVKLQYRKEMQASWAIVDDQFESALILGSRAAQVLLRHSTRAAHHEFPYALSVMAGLVACTNGAKVAVFPSPAGPHMLSVINVNYLQTRKSSTHGSMHEVSKEIDSISKSRAEAKIREDMVGSDEAVPRESLNVPSVVREIGSKCPRERSVVSLAGCISALSSTWTRRTNYSVCWAS